jgi:flagellum-specific peptidoglycan hydrolase FlgJ
MLEYLKKIRPFHVINVVLDYLVESKYIQIYSAMCLLVGMYVTTMVAFNTITYIAGLEVLPKLATTTETTTIIDSPKKLSSMAKPEREYDSNKGTKNATPYYLKEMSEVAIKEQDKFGIPASITLAQYHLESGVRADKPPSDLAVEDNNWFGMKYTDNFYAFLKKRGIVISRGEKRCNRRGKDCANYAVFASRWECFRAKSLLLTNSNYSRIKGDTYIDWAKGLKEYGYATDPNYDKKLIKIVEKFGLAKYDS